MEEKSQSQVQMLKEQPAHSVVLGLKLTAALQQMILNYPLHCEAKRTKENENINVHQIKKKILKIVSGKESFFS